MPTCFVHEGVRGETAVIYPIPSVQESPIVALDPLPVGAQKEMDDEIAAVQSHIPFSLIPKTDPYAVKEKGKAKGKGKAGAKGKAAPDAELVASGGVVAAGTAVGSVAGVKEVSDRDRRPSSEELFDLDRIIRDQQDLALMSYVKLDRLSQPRMRTFKAADVTAYTKAVCNHINAGIKAEQNAGCGPIFESFYSVIVHNSNASIYQMLINLESFFANVLDAWAEDPPEYHSEPEPDEWPENLIYLMKVLVEHKAVMLKGNLSGA